MKTVENEGSGAPDRPLITLKYAQTLDGRLATITGDSHWISGPESRQLAHRLRTEHQAILVGVGTVIADDPLLTSRLWPGPNPLRVVADSRLRIPLSAALLCDGGRTLIATTTEADASAISHVRATGAEVVQFPTDNDQVDLGQLMLYLRSRGIQTVLTEGGSGMITSLFRARLVDLVVVFIAPKIVGHGIDAIGDLEIRRMADAIELIEESVQRTGSDIVFRGRVSWSN